MFKEFMARCEAGPVDAEGMITLNDGTKVPVSQCEPNKCKSLDKIHDFTGDVHVHFLKVKWTCHLIRLFI